MHIPALTTKRVLLRPLCAADSAFIFELMNTDAWKQFIGDRGITSEMIARDYIQNILASPATAYQVAERKMDGLPLGIITLIRRAYLDHPDIGFAFLPAHSGQGYAYEAAKGAIDHLLATEAISHLLAITLPGNKPSIKLLEKLGLCFEKERMIDRMLHWVYSASSEQLLQKQDT